MSHYVKLLSILSTGTLLGCSQVSLAPTQGQPAAATADRTSVLSRVQPVTRVSSPVPEVEGLWLQGRSAHGQGQLTLAEDHYAKVLKALPTHPGALNALAVIYAQTDRLPQAIGLFEQALALQPRASHVFNNLGYALLLAGRLGEAEAALRQARELNPASALTQKNQELLAQAQARGGVTVQPIAVPAAAPTGPTAVTSVTSVTAEPALVSIAPNVYELRDPAPSSATLAPPAASVLPQVQSAAPAPLPAPVSAVASDLRGLRMEVSNGMGVRHMARRTAERLVPLGLVTARLTNQPGYRQMKTELQFGAGQEKAAELLARRLPVAPQLVQGRPLSGDIQLRLVLGHDLRGRAVAAWLDEADIAQSPVAPPSTPALPPVALNPQQGWRWG